MAFDKNLSPVGWYCGSYLCHFIEVHDSDNNNPERKFTSWENTVLVEATSIELAFTKIEKIGRDHAEPYLGGEAPGVLVQWEYLGITELIPVYEEIRDGVEIAWAARKPRKLKNLQQLIRLDSATTQQ